MAWDDPKEKDKFNDPWGKKPNSPPDLDKLIIDFIKKYFGSPFSNKIVPPEGSFPKNALSLFVFFLIAIAWGLWGFYIVNPAENAVVLRFGKYLSTEQSGLHRMMPLIDSRYVVDVQKIYSFPIKDDFLTKSSEEGDLPNPVADKHSSVRLDLNDKSKNMVSVELTVQYTIKDPRAYLFNVVNTDDTIQQVATGALSTCIGEMKLDEVLTTGRENVSTNVLNRMRNILENYGSGLEITAVTLRKVEAPEEVREAFNDVNRADQDKATSIQKAQAYASKVVPRAEGEASRIIADATAYQQGTVLGAKASISKYLALLNVYKDYPDITRKRMYLESLEKVFQRSSKILIDANGTNNMFYLPLDKLNSSLANVKSQSSSVANDNEEVKE